MRTWIEVDTDVLQHNYRLIRRVTGEKVRLMAVVKANAYGHGLIEFARAVQSFGVDWIGVSFLEEALKLRRHNVGTPILILVGSSDPFTFSDAAKNKIAVTITDFQGLEAIRTLPSDVLELLRVHLKIDTGMHRQGFLLHEVPRVVEYLQHSGIPRSIVDGVYTHFGAAEDPESKDDTLTQLTQFQSAIISVRSAGFHPIIHAATTASALIFPESKFDLIRVGAGLYGIWPSQATQKAFENTIPLKGALSWKTIINEIKYLPKGSRIGYEFTATLKKDSIIAICPVGYWHGYRRHLSNTGEVLIQGVRAPIVGRVSMCVIAIDVSGVSDVQVGQEVTLLGKGSSDEEILLDDFALWNGVLNKEIISTIHPDIARRYVGSHSI